MAPGLLNRELKRASLLGAAVSLKQRNREGPRSDAFFVARGLTVFRRAVVAVLLSGLVCLYLASSAPGQTTFGTITGIVTDPSGALVPAAQITITDQATGVAYHAKTGPDGVYTLPDVPVGTYNARVEAKGFTSEERSGLTVYVHNAINVDFKLTVGSASTLVTVQAAPPVIDTQTGTVSNTMIGDQMEELPVAPMVRQGIGIYAFAMYNPGVGVNDSGNFYANGTRQIDTFFSNDGIVDMQDVNGIGGAPSSIDLSTLSEMTAITAGANAEYRSPTNIITASKSGSNHYHGNLYYDWNGTALNARNFFSSTVPFGVVNSYAGSIGGPIKKDKLFFFADYEGLRSRSQAVIDDDTPLPPWTTGNFSDLLSQGVTIVNPYSGQPFSGNQIPSGMINPVAQKVQNIFFPAPNSGPPGLQVGNWTGLYSTYSDMDSVDARVDYNISGKDRIYGRYTYHRVPFTYSPDSNLPPLEIDNGLRTGGSGVISWTHTFSPTVLNEFRGGFARNDEIVAPAVNGYQLFQQLGIQGIPTGPGGNDAPAFNITGITSTEMGSASANIGTDFQLTNNLSWVKGSHSMKFGTDIIRDHISLYGNTDVYGWYNFTGFYTNFPYADFLLGLPQTTGFNLPVPANYFRGTTWSFYAQDQWKATRRLTVDFGLRYELAGPYWEKYGQIFTYDPTLQAIVVPDVGLKHLNPLFPTTIPIVSATTAGYPNPTLQKFNTHNFYPRLGFAYQLTSDGKTVLRGAYGIYGDTIYGTLALSKGGGPFAGSESFYNSITNGTALFTLQNPFIPQAGLLAPFESANVWNPNLTVPYLQQWNLTLQRQIGTVGLSIGYVGSHNTGLLYSYNIDQPPPSTTPFSISELPNPSFSSIYRFDNGSNDEYNSLQTAATKTVGKNLILNASYTWARDLTDSPDNDWIFGPNIQNAFDRVPEWGNNLFTPTHRFYAAAMYALPVGKGQHFLSNAAGWTSQLLGGWRTAYVVTLMTGQWFTPSFDGFDPSNTNNFGGRPDRIAGVPLYPTNRTINDWFNANAFRIPGCPDSTPVCTSPANIGRFGNAAPLQITSPGTRNVDFTLMKDFRFTESKKLQFQAVFANLFNHPAFGYPGSDISATSAVGVITGTVGNYLQGSSPQRTINFVLRFLF